MVEIINLINTLIFHDPEHIKFFCNLLSTSTNLHLNINEIDRIVGIINNQLNVKAERYNGLYILLNFLPYCSTNQLTNNRLLWILKACSVLEYFASKPEEITLACQVLAKYIISCKDIAKVQSQISMENVKQILDIMARMTDNKMCGGVFYLIATILFYHKESAERFKNTIEMLIFKAVDLNQNNVVQGAANCFLLLTQATERSFKAIPDKLMYNNYTYNEALICNSLHSILDSFFSTLNESTNHETWISLKLATIPDEKVFDYLYKMENRFKNLCVFLATMLRGQVEKNSVYPNDILKLLCRGLAVNTFTLQRLPSHRAEILFFILPKIHTSLILVLDALIDGFRRELIPYANIIFKLYKQILKYSFDVENENQKTDDGLKSFVNIRTAVYTSISSWISSLGTLSGIEIIADTLISNYIIKDIIPEKNQILLTIPNSQNSSKKTLKRIRDSQYEKIAYQNITNETKTNFKQSFEVCRSALYLLKNIFYNSGCQLNPSTYQEINKSVISLLYNFYLPKDLHQNFYTQDSNSRLSLLQVLRAVQANPHSLIPPPSQYSIEIFNLAAHDVDVKINEEAKLALADLEKLVHPSIVALGFPILDDKENNDLSDLPFTSTQISDNSAVLNSQVIRDFLEDIDNSNKEKENGILANGNENGVEKDCLTPRKLQKFNSDHDLEESIYFSPINTQNKTENPSNNKKSSKVDDIIIDISDKEFDDILISPPNETTNQEKKDNGNQVLYKIGDKKIEGDKIITVGLEDDSDDEAMLNLFCDQLY